MDLFIGLFVGFVAGAAVISVLWYLIHRVSIKGLKEHSEAMFDNYRETSTMVFSSLNQSTTGLYDYSRQLRGLLESLSTDYTKLNPQIDILLKQNTNLVTETSRLSAALSSDNRKIGNWGEMQLRRVVEIAGMTEYCDFETQAYLDGSRPDMVITMSDNRKVIVDAKASTQAYMDAFNKNADTQTALKKHAASVKGQVDELSKREYGAGRSEYLDLVIMFVPGDQFVSAALGVDPTLIEYAVSKRVIIATPSSMIPMLWAISTGWQHKRIEENASKIKDAGEALYKHMTNFMKNYATVGKEIGQTVKAYNASITNFDRGVATQGRKLGELITGSEPETAELLDIEEAVRESSRAS